MRIGSYDGAGCTECNGTMFVTTLLYTLFLLLVDETVQFSSDDFYEGDDVVIVIARTMCTCDIELLLTGTI